MDRPDREIEQLLGEEKTAPFEAQPSADKLPAAQSGRQQPADARGAPPALGPADSQILHLDPAMDRALVEFRQASRSREVEAICCAYQSVCRAAGKLSMKLADAMALAGVAAGFGDRTGNSESQDESPQARAMQLVVSAYSHRQCFMCRGGMIVCDQCEGSGSTGAAACPHCEGLGAVPCAFCRGAGWADRKTVPPELRVAVLTKQLHRLRQDMHKLPKVLAALSAHKDERGAKSVRLQLIGWLLRLSARTIELLNHRILPPGPEYDRLRTVALKIRRIAAPDETD